MENCIRITKTAIINIRNKAAGGYATPIIRAIISRLSLQTDIIIKISPKNNQSKEYSSLILFDLICDKMNKRNETLPRIEIICTI